ncbi:MAG: class II fructose-bisphosphate aldolase [Rhodobacteraceae bacterium]|nr:class II fructose-bisphosphate aldolase [Paracoccaceae bacterium]
MTVATLTEVLGPALAGGYAVAGLVCLGWEDMRAYVAAAEAEAAPVILQAGPSCRDHTPLPVLGAMMRHLAEAAAVPVVVHLDHARRIDECRAGIEAGFTSVMFDGSALPLRQNIDDTAAVVALARRHGVSCEGEVGYVGYARGARSNGTEPAEAARFARETGVDALAVSIGNLHLQERAGAPLDEARLAAIEAVTTLPLVIHGGSGVPLDQRRRLARTTRVCKFNIGTELRMAFGAALRQALARDPARFDRLAILRETEDPVMQAARLAIRTIGPHR